MSLGDSEQYKISILAVLLFYIIFSTLSLIFKLLFVMALHLEEHEKNLNIQVVPIYPYPLSRCMAIQTT